MTRVIVFAKAPIPGFAKTRLAARLGPEQAAALHARMVEHAVEQACAATPGSVELACAPTIDHPLFEELARRFGVSRVSQGEGDLGARMHRAMGRALADARHAIIIGTDCPGLDANYLRRAAAALQSGHDVVLGPAEDGGYVLVGAGTCESRMFEGIAWSTPGVLADTRSALRACRLSWFELSYLWDVDQPDDFDRLQRDFPALVGEVRHIQPERAI